MKSPPKMPQRAMVRIWVASLHQELRYPMGTGVSVLSVLQNGLQGWIRTAAALSQKTAQKQPSGLFLAARLAQSTRAHQELRYQMGTGVSVLSTLPCCFHFVRLSEQLCKNTVLHNKPGGGQGEDTAIKGGVPGADTVLHKGQLCGGKLLAVQSFVGFKVKSLAQPQL